MTYFKNTNTLEELRKQYKELLKIHHPDNGGNVPDMQQINAEYDRLFKVVLICFIGAFSHVLRLIYGFLAWVYLW